MKAVRPLVRRATIPHYSLSQPPLSLVVVASHSPSIFSSGESVSSQIDLQVHVAGGPVPILPTVSWQS